MFYDESPRGFNFLAGFAIGIAAGAGLALMLAPETGRRTRRRLANAATDAREVAGDRWGDLTEEVRSAVDTGRRRLKL